VVNGVIAEDNLGTQASLLATATSDPAKAAEAQILASQYNVPVDVVTRNLEQFRQQATIDQAYEHLTGAPSLRLQFTDPNFAGSSIDDVSVLSSLEGNLQSAAELKPWQPPPASIGTALSGLTQSFDQSLRGIRIGLDQQASDWFTKYGWANNQDASSSDYWYRKRLDKDFQDLQFEKRNSTPHFDSATAQALYGGAAGLVQMAPALAITLLTRNPAPMLWASALGTEANAYAELKSQGGSTEAATLGALGEGAVSYALGKLPVGVFFKNLDQGSTVALLTKVVGVNATAAQVQRFVQDAIDMSIAHPDMTWSDFMKERPGRAYETLVSSIFQSAVLAGAGRVTLGQGSVSDKPIPTEQLIQAEGLAGNLRGALDLARQSKLAARDPLAFQRSIQAMGDAHGLSVLHLSSDALMRALATPGVDARAILTRMPETLAQLRNLPAQGGDLRIPTGELITGLKDSGVEEAILPHLRRAPDQMSLDQLKQAMVADKAPAGDAAATGASQSRPAPASSPNDIDASAAQPAPNAADQAGSPGSPATAALAATATPAALAKKDSVTMERQSLLGWAKSDDSVTEGRFKDHNNEDASTLKGAPGAKSVAVAGQLRGVADDVATVPAIGGRAPINGKYAGQLHPSGVAFTAHGFPDFTPHAMAEVKIANLSGNYAKDSALANLAV
jgi:hypothetical protein